MKAIICGAGVFAGLTALASEKVFGCFGTTFVGQRSLAARDADLDRVEPRPLRLEHLRQLGQVIAIHHLRISVSQHRKRGIGIGWTTHKFLQSLWR